MSDKRLYPNTVIFKGTDDNEITYINERVLEQIRAEIYEHFMTIDGQVHDKSAIKCMEIIGKYKGDKE